MERSCARYSYKNAHRIQGISETWGWRCWFYLSSTVTIDDQYMQTTVPCMCALWTRNVQQRNGKDSDIWRMYDNYFGDYEYFYLAGIVHVIVENLRPLSLYGVLPRRCD
jgi:hypothetical protein